MASPRDSEEDDPAVSEEVLDSDSNGEADDIGGAGADASDPACTVHVSNVPSAATMADVAALFAHLGSAFCYRVSDSVVAVQLETTSAVEAAVAMSGSVLTPPKSGHITFPGEVITVVAQAN